MTIANRPPSDTINLTYGPVQGQIIGPDAMQNGQTITFSYDAPIDPAVDTIFVEGTGEFTGLCSKATTVTVVEP